MRRDIVPDEDAAYSGVESVGAVREISNLHESRNYPYGLESIVVYEGDSLTVRSRISRGAKVRL